MLNVFENKAIDSMLHVNKIKTVKLSTRIAIYSKLSRAQEYIDENYSNSLTNLEAISRHVAMDQYHLIRNFRTVYGITPHKYLRYVRLKNAATLLADTKLSVSEICWDVGFESLGTFSTLFKKKFGYSPMTYRLFLRNSHYHHTNSL